VASAKVLGVALLAGGLVLLGFGLNASSSPADQAKEFFTGEFTNRTMLMIIGGAVISAAGLGALLLPGRKA
jgi:hypothetical protein